MKNENTINSIHSLEKEIEYRKNQAARVEQELKSNMDHLKNHYPSYLPWPFSYVAKRQKSGSSIGTLLEDENVQSFFSKIIDRTANKRQALARRFLGRMLWKFRARD